jgi:hypothetical protein
LTWAKQFTEVGTALDALIVNKPARFMSHHKEF